MFLKFLTKLKGVGAFQEGPHIMSRNSSPTKRPPRSPAVVDDLMRSKSPSMSSEERIKKANIDLLHTEQELLSIKKVNENRNVVAKCSTSSDEGLAGCTLSRGGQMIGQMIGQITFPRCPGEQNTYQETE